MSTPDIEIERISHDRASYASPVCRITGLTDAGTEFIDSYNGPDLNVVDSGVVVISVDDLVDAFVSACTESGLIVARESDA